MAPFLVLDSRLSSLFMDFIWGSLGESGEVHRMGCLHLCRTGGTAGQVVGWELRFRRLCLRRELSPFISRMWT